MHARRVAHRNAHAIRVNAGPGIPSPRPAVACNPLPRRLSHVELAGAVAVLRWCWAQNFLRRRRR
jgi:hypothetical protein